MDEEWREIEGFPDYQISSLGNARSRRQGGRWKPLIASPQTNGYPCIQMIGITGKRVCRTIHTLVLKAFRGPCPPGMESLHGDGCRTNCALTNLRWGTPLENGRDRVAHGTTTLGRTRDPARCARGERMGNARLNADGVRRILATDDVPALVRELGVSPNTAYDVLRGRTWKHVSGL